MLLVFLVLAAQYESWTLPLAVILIVPMSILCALIGVKLTGGDNNIFTQIALFVLVGLASKNAILIVEFARELEDHGRTVVEAALEACRLRLRPILMTSIAFIMGVVPLVFSSGAGAEMRHAMGVAVFGGMLGVTFFGLFLTPVFYVLLRTFAKRFGKKTRCGSRCTTGRRPCNEQADQTTRAAAGGAAAGRLLDRARAEGAGDARCRRRSRKSQAPRAADGTRGSRRSRPKRSRAASGGWPSTTPR